MREEKISFQNSLKKLQKFLIASLSSKVKDHLAIITTFIGFFSDNGKYLFKVYQPHAFFIFSLNRLLLLLLLLMIRFREN